MKLKVQQINAVPGATALVIYIGDRPKVKAPQYFKVADTVEFIAINRTGDHVTVEMYEKGHIAPQMVVNLDSVVFVLQQIAGELQTGNAGFTNEFFDADISRLGQQIRTYLATPGAGTLHDVVNAGWDWATRFNPVADEILGKSLKAKLEKRLREIAYGRRRKKSHGQSSSQYHLPLVR